MIPDLWSSRSESTTSKLQKSGFYPGNTQERNDWIGGKISGYGDIKLFVEWTAPSTTPCLCTIGET